MSIYAIVKKKRKLRKGEGFSRDELREVGLSSYQALKMNIPIDRRRSTKHEENVKTLKAYVEEKRIQPSIPEEKEEIVELIEVKGIGIKTAEKFIEAGIKNANELVASNLERVAEALGSSKSRASSLIENARSSLKGKKKNNKKNVR